MSSNLNETSFAATEEKRIISLYKYDLLDTPPDEKFDRITRYTADLFNVPICMISIVDKDRIWFKSRVGFTLSEIPREIGLCALTILSDDTFVIENGLLDPRTKNHPWVSAAKGYLFYAAAPLKVADGSKIGTLCIVDKLPRIFSEREKKLLAGLADIVVDLMDFQLVTSKTTRKFKERLNTSAHEIKNPLTSISLWAEYIQADAADPEIRKMAVNIKESSVRILGLVNKSLQKETGEDKQTLIDLPPINLSAIVTTIAAANRPLAAKKNQLVQTNIENDMMIHGDELEISEIIDNLISNAIKFSYTDTIIKIILTRSDKTAMLKVIDQGPGLSEKDFSELFLPFTQLSAKPTANEMSSGLGLSIVKEIVQKHHGKIYCENNSSGKGACFIVELNTIETT